MNELNFSPIGFGGWAIGSQYKYGWGPCDPLAAIHTIRTAAELGVNWIDTAPVYGYGHSERVVGLAVRHLPESMKIATKCGLVWDKNDNLRRNLTPLSIEREVNDSLTRLGVECIDLMQTHWPDLDTPIEETWYALSKLVNKGKIRFLGACNCDAEALKAMQTIHRVSYVQIPYNLLRRDVEKDVLPYCQALGISVLAYSPMHSGVLTGEYSRRKLHQSDWRLRKSDWYSEEAQLQLAKIISVLICWARKKNATPGQIAIAWSMSHPAVSSAIVGVRSPGQVIDNVRSLSVHLTPDERLQLGADVEAASNESALVQA